MADEHEGQGGNPILRSLQGVDWDRVFVLRTKHYNQDYGGQELNGISWQEFCQNEGVLLVTHMPTQPDLDVAVVPKSVTWSDRDINLYVGSTKREVRSYMDFTEEEFIDVFDMHIQLARRLAAETGEDVYVTHGFNPVDTAPDAHSIRSKFHTHVNIPDITDRESVDKKDLSQFQRLMLVEPYAHIFWDYVSREDQNRRLLGAWDGEEHDGFFTLRQPDSGYDKDSLRDIAHMLARMEEKYEEVTLIFTDGETEEGTGYDRYVPLSADQRERYLVTFIEANQDWLSDESIALLRYLADNLQEAEPRHAKGSVDITSSSQLWIAKGLSGAFNFVVSATDGSVRFNFAPRVVSTSGATKILSTEPTIIIKNAGTPTDAEAARMATFESQVIQVTKDLLEH